MDDPGNHSSERPHPDVEFDRLASGRATPDERRRALRHLLAGCRRCGSRLLSWLEARPADDGALDAAFRRAMGGLPSLARRVAAEASAAEEFVDRLQHLPVAHQRLLVTNSELARSRAVGERLLALGRVQRTADPRAAGRLADLAARVAQRCGEPGADELLARALAERGNAHRHLGDFAAAAADLAAAGRALKSVPAADPLAGAELLSLQASLATDLLRFPEAFGLLRRAAAGFRRLGDLPGLARVLVQTGFVATRSGEAEAGIAPLREAVELLADLDEPRLRLAASHNLANLLLDAGDPQQACFLLQRLRPFYTRTGTRTDRLRFDWLAARIDLALDRPQRAAAMFAALRVRFAQEDLAHDAALVSLDLALALRRLGQRQQVAALAAETATLFAALGVAREHIAALSLLAEAEAEKLAGMAAGLAAAVEKRRREAAAAS